MYINLHARKFKIGDDTNLLVLLAFEGADKILKTGGKIFIDIGAHIGKYFIL